MEGPQTSIQLPPPGQEQSPLVPSRHWGLSQPVPAGCARLCTALSSPQLKEMSAAHSLSCNKPQQSHHHLPGILFLWLCGQTRSDPPPIPGGDFGRAERKAAGNTREQQQSHWQGQEPQGYGNRDTVLSQGRGGQEKTPLGMGNGADVAQQTRPGRGARSPVRSPELGRQNRAGEPKRGLRRQRGDWGVKVGLGRQNRGWGAKIGTGEAK